MASKKKRARRIRTLMDPDYRKHVAAEHRNWDYPSIVRGLDEIPDEDRLEYESDTFADVLEYERHADLRKHGVMAGAITVQEAGQKARSLEHSQRLFEIPNFVEPDALKFSEVHARGVLLIEIGTTFEHLLAAGAADALKMILVCGWGIPRMPTRRLLHRLNTEFKLPVYVLTDNDTWGYFIFSVVKRGMLAPHANCRFHSVEDVRFLGLRAQDYARLGLPKNILLPEKPHSKLRIQHMRSYACFMSQVWQREFDAFLRQRGSFELAAIARIGEKAFLRDYLQPKLAAKNYLR
jgi:DNA topoisomerase VI subunit A